MKEILDILSVYFIVIALVFMICLGFNIPFSLAKATGTWGLILLLGIAKRIIFD